MMKKANTLILMLCMVLSVHAQSTVDSLYERFGQTKGQKRLELANSLMRQLADEQVTDSLMQFDAQTPADTVTAQVCFWVGEQKCFAGEYETASVLFEKTIPLISPTDLTFQSDCHNELAVCYARRGLFEEAIAQAAQIVDIDEQLGDKERLIVSLNIMGSIYIMSKQPAKAEKYVLQSLQLTRELGDSAKMAVRYGTMAELRQTQGDFEQALDYAREGLRIDSLRGDQGKAAIRRVQMANALSHLGRNAEAWQLLTAARPVLEASGNVVSLTICLNQMGYVALQQQRWAEAADSYEQAYLIYNKTGDRNSKATSLWGLWHALIHTDPQQAARYMETYSALKDSLYQQDVARMTADYNAKYENDELNRQNEQARQRNRMLLIGGGLALAAALVIISLLLFALRTKSRSARMQRQLRQQRDRFFTNITHELRTPLTVINAATDELLDRADTREQAQAIQRHSQTLLDLTNQMLDMARLSQTGDARPQVWVRGDISAFVQVMCESYAAYARSKGVVLQAAAATAVEADFIEDCLRKIVHNLLVNAINHSPSGTTVTVAAAVRDQRLSLSVSDHGEGIDPEALAHIFEPFYRASSSMPVVGSGVGLSLARLCAEAMQGSLGVESTVDVGSVFTLTMPLHHPGVTPQTIDVAQTLKVDAPKATPPNIQPLTDDGSDSENLTRLLIVEDAPEVAHYIARLMPADYRVSYASDGRGALDKARSLVPDLVVTDVMMPGMDGLELCRALRADPLLCHVPVVMVSAKALPEDRLAGLKAGAGAYLEKPFSSEELRVRIETLLEQRRLLQQSYREMAAGATVSEAHRQPLSERDMDFLEKVERLLEQQMQACNVSLEQMASDLCITRLQLNRKMKALLGENMRDHVNRIRKERACRLIEEGNLNITEVALACGIDDAAYFSRLFKKLTGLSPSEYKSLRRGQS